MSKFSKIAIILLICIFVFSSVSLAYVSNYTEPTSLLRWGSRGTGVKWLQDMLNHNGYNLSVDGIFGNATYSAVVNFQRSRGLVIDGIVGAKTKMALKQTLGLPAFNRNNSTLLGVIKACKSYYANNNFYYSAAAGVRSIPADRSKSYGGCYYVDCSSYVSWTLYEYARANGKISMRDYFSYQRSSSTFASIGANGGNNYLQVVSAKTAYKNVDLAKARAGDILVTKGHVEFLYTYLLGSNNTVTIKVYNCGSNSSVKVNGITTSATKNVSDILYVLRVK